MPFLNDRVLDNGLSVLTAEGERLHICSSEPADYSGVASVSLGNKNGISIGAPGARSPSGRKVTVAQIASGSPGDVTATGTASHYAIVDDGNERLLAASTLSSSQAVTNGNTFTLAAFDIGIPGPA